MGDRHRHTVFADFVQRNFPDARTVLAVADGKGKLAIELAHRGYEVKIVEPKLQKFSRRFLHGQRHRGVTFKRSLFDADEARIEEDLIVGMHPDEATSEIVMAATAAKKPFAVVPCCILGRHSEHAQGFDDWIRLLKRLARKHVNQTALKMRGRNTVLYAH